MDMMSILLVFMIKQMSQAPTMSSDVSLPTSTTKKAPPDQQVMVTVAKTAIIVEGDSVAPIVNGDVPAGEKSQGKYGLIISQLEHRLEQEHTRIKTIYAAHGTEDPKEVFIIADKNTPYRIISEILYSAGQAEFQNYRMIVLRTEE
jgi:biopolymer transport protein ExbD